MAQFFFQEMLDFHPVLYCVVDHQCRIVYMNQTFLTVLGYQPQELTGTSFLDLISGEDQEKFRDTILALPPDTLKVQNRCLQRNGTPIPVLWSARWDHKENLLHLVGHEKTNKSIEEHLNLKFTRKIEETRLQVHEAYDRITDGFLVLDQEWRITYVNKTAETILGNSKGDLLAHSLWECFPEATGTIFEEEYTKAIQQQTAVHFEAYYPEPLNQWLDVSAYPYQSGLSIFFRDISERKRVEMERLAYERKIEEQNNRMSEILESITDAFYAVDNNWTVTYWNHQAEKLTGKKREEMLSRNLFECLPGAKGTTIESNFFKAMSQRLPIVFEAPSTVRPLLLKFFIYPSPNGLTVVYRDITEKRKMQEELKILSLLAKETVNAVSLVNPKGDIQWVNEAFSRITGYTLEEARGKSNSELLVGPDTDLAIDAEMKMLFSEGKRFKGELLGYTREKKKVWLLSFGQPVLDQEGKLQYYFVTHSDVTPRKQLEEQLEIQRRKTTAAVIEAQEKERSEIGRELHDNVNQILTTVKLYLEFGLDHAGTQELITRKSIGLLQESINEIRNLSKRLSAPTIGSIKLAASIRELCSMVSTTSKFTITVHTSDIEELEIEEELHLAVYRIVQEHLTNILKHAEAKNVAVVMDFEEGYLLLKITDDGKGFNPAASRNGIGISNMMTRAENLGGTLTICSTAGSGCQLNVRFPCESEYMDHHRPKP